MMAPTRARKLCEEIAASTFEVLPADTSERGGTRDDVLLRLILIKLGKQGSVSMRELPAMVQEAGELADYIHLHDVDGAKA